MPRQIAAILLALAAVALLAEPAAGSVHVVATGLNQPKQITVASDGSLIVALSGDGRDTAGCRAAHADPCLDGSGAIDRVTTSGRVSTLARGLDSLSYTSSGGQATGPAAALLVHGHLHVLFQDAGMSSATGEETYGSGGRWLGDLVAMPVGSDGSDGVVQASFGPFEARHDPDGGAGTDVRYGDESAIDSDPYAIVAYRGGYAVADAGGNDVLYVSRTGRISLLAVLPTIRERAPARTFGSGQRRPIVAQAQPVPDSIAVGPGGALYVGELGGEPYAVGRSSVYRIVPGHRATRYATGLTSVGAIAFDGHGDLYALEIDARGLAHPSADGALVRIGPRGRRTAIAAAGLRWPTGLAIVDGVAYIANRGIEDGSRGGEIVSVSLP